MVTSRLLQWTLRKSPKTATVSTLLEFGQFSSKWQTACLIQSHRYKYLIKKNLIDFGFAGWMADFGEYTPMGATSKYEDRSDIFHMKPMIIRWLSVSVEVEYYQMVIKTWVADD